MVGTTSNPEANFCIVNSIESILACIPLWVSQDIFTKVAIPQAVKDMDQIELNLLDNAAAMFSLSASEVLEDKVKKKKKK